MTKNVDKSDKCLCDGCYYAAPDEGCCAYCELAGCFVDAGEKTCRVRAARVARINRLSRHGVTSCP